MFELIVLFLLVVVLLGLWMKHRAVMREQEELAEEERKRSLPLPMPTRLGGVKQVRRLTPYKSINPVNKE
jgi:hypothetical protein